MDRGDVTKFPLTWPLATHTITIWSTDCDLCLNSARSKVMVFSSQQLSRVYGLRTCSVEVSVEGKKLERLKNSKLLCTISKKICNGTMTLSQKCRVVLTLSNEET